MAQQNKNKNNQRKKPQRNAAKKSAAERQNFGSEDAGRLIQLAVFAVSLIFFFLAIVSGEGAWNAIHNFYVGVFGIFCAVLLPVVTICVTIVYAIKNITPERFAVKSAEALVIAMLTSAFIHIVQNTSGADFTDAVKDAFINAPESFNGGVIGAVLGWVMLTCGKAPAIIIDLILIFVDFMLLTGITIIQFFKGMGTPAKKAVETVAPVIEEKLNIVKIKNLILMLSLTTSRLK